MPNGDEKYPYSFPFPPYKVQRELMDAITSAIDTRSFGLFESPTGTGKTLSVICATLSWLVDHRLDPQAHAALRSAEEHGSEEVEPQPPKAEPDWVLQHAERRAVAALQSTLDRRSRLSSLRVRRVDTRLHAGVGRRGVKAQRLGEEVLSLPRRSGPHLFAKTDGKFLLDAEHCGASSQSNNELESEDEHCMLDNAPQVSSEADEDAPDTAPRLRLVFATRTHTQLSQFVTEFRKTCFASAAEDPPTLNGGSRGLTRAQLSLSVMLFGSRKVMCINDAVQTLPTASAVSERCRELTAGNARTNESATRKRALGKDASKCCFKDSTVEKAMRDMILVRAHDVEELAETGRELQGCPYFATRAAISTGAVDVLGVPYSAILHAQTRESLGITIDSQTVVVFDEGHNVVDAVNEIHSASLSRVALEATRGALKAYRQRYEARLSPQNLFSVNQILSAVDGLLALLASRKVPPDVFNERSSGPNASGAPAPRVLSPSSLIFEAGIDNLNLFQLSAFIRTTRLRQKLCGFVDSGLSDDVSGVDETAMEENSRMPTSATSKDASDVEKTRRRSRHGIASFESFLIALSSDTRSGRIALYPGGETDPADCDSGRMKYFILDPGDQFSSMMSGARAVILVGGTLSPRDALKHSLFAGLSKNRKIVEFECDHVIPSSSLTAMVCATGPSNLKLEFTRHTRSDLRVVDELGNMLLRVATSSPGGIVLFFASYSYMSFVSSRWADSGTSTKLESVKPLFQEERGHVGIFDSYSDAVRRDHRRGAILLSVLGGRLSEGINFSDELGRVVMVVGMPFANATDIETREILSNLPDARRRSEYLENACMTIVNQAIGRAIRHRSDYAAIILCDRRYARPGTEAKLPKFVRQSLLRDRTFDSNHRNVKLFFAGHL